LLRIETFEAKDEFKRVMVGCRLDCGSRGQNEREASLLSRRP